MGRIAKVLEVIRQTEDGLGYDLRVDDGTSDGATVPLYLPAGDDAPPLPGDWVALTDSEESSGGEMALGGADGRHGPVAANGERRLYARSSAGAVTAVVHLRGNGRVEVTGPGARPPVGVSRSDVTDARLSALESGHAALQSLFNAHIHPHPLGPTGPTATPSVPPLAPGQPTGSQVLISE